MMENAHALSLVQRLRKSIDSINIRKFLLILMAVVLITILTSMILSVNFLLHRYAAEFTKEGAQLVRDQELAEGIYTLAVENVNEQIRSLSLVISGIMTLAFLLLFLILNIIFVNMIKAPLTRIGEKARQISENHVNLGEQIKAPIFKEMQELTQAFNRMSTTLQQQMNALEEKVQERTVDLETAKKKIEHLAAHDSLTGLPNRRALNEQFTKMIGSIKKTRESLALMMIDLDNYKLINDQYGHLVGDEVLQEVGHRFEEILRESDLISRWGGDEFVILLQDVNRKEDIKVVIDKLFSAFSNPLFVDDRQFTIQMSLGIAMYPQDGDTMESLMQNADTALYQAKNTPGNSYQFYRAGFGD